ncbi:MAG: hypothetical protein EOM20_18765 [Spartobacteria bacterium]|nr:hypothetical protein [Spartobacteria bacterium]
MGGLSGVQEAEARKGKMYLWATSLRELAGGLDEPILNRELNDTPEWSMVPLMVDYDLAFGYIRARLTNVTMTLECGPIFSRKCLSPATKSRN